MLYKDCWNRDVTNKKPCSNTAAVAGGATRKHTDAHVPELNDRERSGGGELRGQEWKNRGAHAWKLGSWGRLGISVPETKSVRGASTSDVVVDDRTPAALRNPP